MADITFNPLRARTKGCVILSGVININASAVVTSNSAEGGAITSVARTGTGAYRITLAQKYSSLVTAMFIPGGSTTIPLFCHMNASAVTSSPATIDFKTVNSVGAPTDNSGNSIAVYFILVLKNTSAS